MDDKALLTFPLAAEALIVAMDNFTDELSRVDPSPANRLPAA